MDSFLLFEKIKVPNLVVDLFSCYNISSLTLRHKFNVLERISLYLFESQIAVSVFGIQMT